jgi:Zn-dependent M28 family amino/carboxypeptidase
LVEIARAMAKRGRPQRSVAFVGWTLEEPGILGSQYYAEHPVYPLETTVAVVNFDSMVPFGLARDFSQNADPANDLTGMLEQAGARQGRRMTIEPHKDWFARMRSDHAPLVRAGVPALFYLAGEDLVDGGRPRAEAWFKNYFARNYHQQSDNYDASWNVAGIVQDVALVSDFAWSLANSRAWPEWQAGAEFKVVRDRSASARR